MIDYDDWREAVETIRSVPLSDQVMHAVSGGMRTAGAIQGVILGFTPSEIKASRDVLVKTGRIQESAFVNAGGYAQKKYEPSPGEKTFE